MTSYSLTCLSCLRNTFYLQLPSNGPPHWVKSDLHFLQVSLWIYFYIQTFCSPGCFSVYDCLSDFPPYQLLDNQSIPLLSHTRYSHMILSIPSWQGSPHWPLYAGLREESFLMETGWIWRSTRHGRAEVLLAPRIKLFWMVTLFIMRMEMGKKSSSICSSSRTHIEPIGTWKVHLKVQLVQMCADTQSYSAGEC